MPAKATQDQTPKQRVPRQARAREKVELILEAAVRLLERDGIDALNTNALAETAGISIGTLYQYFRDKNAVLTALAQREMAALSARVLGSFENATVHTPTERIRAVTHAVLAAYGGRRRAHRLVMSHAIARGGGLLAPLFSQLIQRMTTQGVAAPGKTGMRLSDADAFVLTHAIAGVLRTLAAQGTPHPPREEIEESLAKLIQNFLGKG